MTHSQFLFATCQAGAEGALKREAEQRAPGLKPAFSRPGFVTFKSADPIDLESDEIPRLVFARTRGLALGRLDGGDHLRELARRVWALDDVRQLVERHAPLGVHVWQRDTALPGEGGFEPGANVLSGLVREAVVAAAPPGAVGQDTPQRAGAALLDVALVEPNAWWVGAHLARARTDRCGLDAERPSDCGSSRAGAHGSLAGRRSLHPPARADGEPRVPQDA